MNKELEEVIKLYSTQDHFEVTKYLLEKSKDSVNAILLDLLTMYFNDKNSSTLREYMLVTVSGFTPSEEKLGYNGYRQTTIDGKRVVENCEAKPKNINTNKAKITKLSGGGGFNDYTFERLEKHKKENPTVLVGGFIDGKLIHVFRFSFNSHPFVKRLRKQLLKKYPNGKDVKGDWLRSATFGLNDYKNIADLSVDVLVSKNVLLGFRKYITRPLYEFLEVSANGD